MRVYPQQISFLQQQISVVCLQQKDFNNQHNQCASLNLLLKQWATNLNVNHKQLDSLLKILKPYHPQ
jgi:hypothetical protein